MESTKTESYFVFMNYDPEYERLRADKSVSIYSHKTHRHTHNIYIYIYYIYVINIALT